MSEPLERCDNCLKELPESKIATHLSYCRRNIKKCKKCGDLYDVNFYEQHEEEFHTKNPCPHCKVEFLSSDLKNHEESCSKRPKYCEYCELNVQKDAFDAHFKQCEAMTRLCEKCSKHIRNKDFFRHSLECKGPVPVFNNYEEHIREQRQRIIPQQDIRKIDVYTEKYTDKREGQKIVKPVPRQQQAPKIAVSKSVNEPHVAYKAPKIAFVHKMQKQEPMEQAYDYRKKQINYKEDASKLNSKVTTTGMAGKQIVSQYQANPPDSKPITQFNLHDQMRSSKPIEIKKNLEVPRAERGVQILREKEVKPTYAEKNGFYKEKKNIMESYKREIQIKKLPQHKINDPIINPSKAFQLIHNQPLPQQQRLAEMYEQSTKIPSTKIVSNKFQPVRGEKNIGIQSNKQQRVINQPKVIENHLGSKPTGYYKKDRVDYAEGVRNQKVIHEQERYFSSQTPGYLIQNEENLYLTEEERQLQMAIEMSLKNQTAKDKSKQIDLMNESFTKQRAIYEDIQRKNRR